MKKICFLVGTLSGGGSERVCVNLANDLVTKEKWGLDLLVLNSGDGAYKNLLNPNVNFLSLDVDNARYAFFPLVRYLKQERPELILVFSYELAVLLVCIKKLYRLDYKIVARNVNTFSRNLKEKGSYWRKGIVVPLIKKLYGKADYYINQCHDMQKDLLKNYPELTGRTCVINNPIKDDLFIKPTKINSEKGDYILCVGRLEAQKSFSHAISAFAGISQEHPHLKLIIIGKGSLENELRLQVEALGLAHRIIFEGFKNNVEDYYLSARATILTSEYEGFPNVLLESIALGTPVIAYDCPSGPKEIILNSINGYLIEYRDIEAMSRAISKVITETFDPEIVRATVLKYKCSKILLEYEERLSILIKKSV